MALALAQDPGIDTVVIGASWNAYGFFVDSGGSEKAFEAFEAMVRNYRRIGRQVYLILPIPTGAEFDPYHLVKRSLRDFGFKVVEKDVEQAKIVAELKPIASRLAAIASSTGAMAIDPVEYLCPEGGCPTLTDDGLPTYMDYNHLRPSFVREHVTFLDAIVSTR